MLTVFLLGSVFTQEDFRQQGISTTILKEVYRYIDQIGASLLFVSGNRGMYMRNHCYHFGEANKYLIGKSSVNKEGFTEEVHKGQTTDIFQIDRLK